MEDTLVELNNNIEIVQKYGAVIEAVSFMILFGASDQLLHHKKEDIKTAIKKVLLYEFKKEERDQAMIENLKTVYTQLASFIPKDIYEQLKPLYVIGPIEHFKRSTEEKKKTINKITDGIRKEALDLENELRLFCSSRERKINLVG